MKIKVYVIDMEIPHAVKRTLIRVGGPLVLLLAFGSVVNAAPPTLHSWVMNDPLTATDLNGNFTAVNAYAGGLENRIAALETKIVVTRNGKKWSLGAINCGDTSPTTGLIGGYASAKTACEGVAACGNSPSAHMCTSEELVRSTEVGINVGAGWYSSGVGAGSSDCAGWTTNNSGVLGGYWAQPPTQPETNTCNVSTAILCCD